MVFSGSGVGHISVAALCWVWLVLGWVTISRFNSWYGLFISVSNQPPGSTQPGHPSVSRCSEFKPEWLMMFFGCELMTCVSCLLSHR